LKGKRMSFDYDASDDRQSIAERKQYLKEEMDKELEDKLKILWHIEQYLIAVKEAKGNIDFILKEIQFYREGNNPQLHDSFIHLISIL
jgi:hypothetical protein